MCMMDDNEIKCGVKCCYRQAYGLAPRLFVKIAIVIGRLV